MTLYQIHIWSKLGVASDKRKNQYYWQKLASKAEIEHQQKRDAVEISDARCSSWK